MCYIEIVMKLRMCVSVEYTYKLSPSSSSGLYYIERLAICLEQFILYTYSEERKVLWMIVLDVQLKEAFITHKVSDKCTI